MAQPEPPRLSPEEVEWMSKSIMAEGWIFTFVVLEEALGRDAAMERLRPHIRNAGHAFASTIKERYRIDGNDIQAIAAVHGIACEVTGLQISEDERSDRAMVWKCERCVWKSSHIGICLMGHMWASYIIEAVDPRYEYQMLKMMTRGDPFCSWKIEKKGV
jgi:predicted hydrocarbon binding protein